MKIYLIDGTYELFRNHFGAPPRKALDGREVGATLGLVRSLYALLQAPHISHVAVAFDHVIESFRNDLYAGYKSRAGVDPNLLAQFPLAEEAVAALGLTVWPMVEFEADDALASATARFKKLSSVEQIVLASPDKDLAQLVSGKRIVCWDRRREAIMDEAGVLAKFGVRPESIPDWLALVGDSADGYPGIRGLGGQIHLGGAPPIPAPGSDPAGPTEVEGQVDQRGPRGNTGGGVVERAGGGAALPQAGDAAHRCTHPGKARRPRVARGPPSFQGNVP